MVLSITDTKNSTESSTLLFLPRITMNKIFSLENLSGFLQLVCNICIGSSPVWSAQENSARRSWALICTNSESRSTSSSPQETDIRLFSFTNDFHLSFRISMSLITNLWFNTQQLFDSVSDSNTFFFFSRTSSPNCYSIVRFSYTDCNTSDKIDIFKIRTDYCKHNE